MSFTRKQLSNRHTRLENPPFSSRTKIIEREQKIWRMDGPGIPQDWIAVRLGVNWNMLGSHLVKMLILTKSPNRTPDVTTGTLKTMKLFLEKGQLFYSMSQVRCPKYSSFK